MSSGSSGFAKAVHDRALVARVVRRTRLRYDAGADAAIDRPAHVRAGSGLVCIGPGCLAVVQDDAHFIALLDLDAAGHVAGARAVTLPAGRDGQRLFDDGRGTKQWKLDLECCVVGPDRDGRPLFLAFGSGSSRHRERVLVVRGLGDAGARDTMHAVTTALVNLPALYAALRAQEDFAGSDLNVEGAAFVEGAVRLFSRGNGRARDEVPAVDATCDLAWPALVAHLDDPEHAPPPEPAAIRRHALGALPASQRHGDGRDSAAPLHFTDAAHARGAFWFVAAAEDSDDAVSDGLVAGSVLGVLDAAGGARWTPLVDENGAALVLKAEGLYVPATGDRVYVVADPDDHDAPCELCEVMIDGAWPGRAGAR